MYAWNLCVEYHNVAWFLSILSHSFYVVNKTHYEVIRGAISTTERFTTCLLDVRQTQAYQIYFVILSKKNLEERCTYLEFQPLICTQRVLVWNDNPNGIERPVLLISQMNVKQLKVQSRHGNVLLEEVEVTLCKGDASLYKYECDRDEELDNLPCLSWSMGLGKVITKEERTEEMLEETMCKIFLQKFAPVHVWTRMWITGLI